MENEIWKDIVGYEDYYQCSNLGRVKSLDRIVIRVDNVKINLKSKFRKNRFDKDGYLFVKLSKNGSDKSYKVHQLVAMAFLNHKPCGLKKVVDHKNNIKTDNRLDNIQVISNRKNCSKDRVGSSKYTGVCFCKQTGKWKSQINNKGKHFNLGRFDSEIEAYEVYSLELDRINKNPESKIIQISKRKIRS